MRTLGQEVASLPFYRGDDLVGHLVGDAEGHLSFVYAESWKGGSISPSLPPGADHEAVRAWFRELMPGERRRKAFETLTRLSLDRIRQFLYWHGEDLPGDLSVVPASEPADPRDITRFLEGMLAAGGSLDHAAFKLSLAGGEPKTAVIHESGKFFAPSASRPSTHILKGSRGLTAIEDHTMQLARICDLFPVAEVRPVALGGMPVLLIGRFDRGKGADGRVRRLMQEDFCQALGTNCRYGTESASVETDGIARLIGERLPAGDAETFLMMSFFSMHAGNFDDHAGNFAMLERDGIWRLAPAYDIVSVETVRRMAAGGDWPLDPAYSMIDAEQARKFGRHRDALEIDGGDFRIMGDLFGIDPERLRRMGIECGERILASLDALAEHQHAVWERLDARDAICDFALGSLEAFRECVAERTEMLLSAFDRAKPAAKRKPRLSP